MKNIMYLLDIENADDVDVYCDSHDSNYDEEEWYIWYVNYPHLCKVC